MTNGRKYTAPPAGAYFFHLVQTTILDANIINILSEMYSELLRGRYSMTDQNNNNSGDTTPDPPPKLPVQSQAQEKLKPGKEKFEVVKIQGKSETLEEKERLEQQKEKEEQAKKTQEELTTSAWRQLIHDEADEISEQLIKYAIQAFAGLVLFGLFFFTSVGAELLCRIWPEISIMIIIKIVAWSISALGGLCCIAFVVRNTILLFMKFLKKGPPQETSVPNVAGEGRVG